ncbi:hypothetical protein Rhe02_67590 [Rhizocola hellebori]|uniref:Tetratricopeptide repeat protein n=1 Tax=Rhizocola hellebori TaxID=1392758 RepID=A0A8J3QFK5_9ACTN|nr:FxSxx-COOH system tetratricopeptide repeat protein [Rhizocola hellebori]GIH08692.1 hypothetical protein Rhe02_67590 [Rhizocola hellebori]
MEPTRGASAGQRSGGRIVTFYSYKGGTGRTMALANVAWILASNGKRVLAVDWDLESPGLQRYLHPFLVDKQLRSSTGVIDLVRDYADATLERHSDDRNPNWFTDYARVSRHAFSLTYDFPAPGGLDFLPAGQQGPGYGDAVNTFDWGNFYTRLGGGAFLSALRDDLRNRYDYVLIDSRTGLSDIAGICTVTLPDIVVDCFTFSTQSIEGAAVVAQSIEAQRTNEKIRILPVPMRVEDGELLKLEAGRDFARMRFDRFLSGLSPEALNHYWGDIEIPYKKFYAYEEILAPFGDRPHQEYSLLKAYERLADVITNGAVTSLQPMDERTRRRLLAEYERPKQTLPGHVLIGYASVDRVWAEWIRSVVPAANRVTMVEVERADTEEFARGLGTASRALMLLSHEYMRTERGTAMWELAVHRDPGESGPFLIPVRLDNVRLPAQFPERGIVELGDASTENRARDMLLTALDLSSSMPGDAQIIEGAPRFPKTPVPISNLPQRNAIFTGRSAALELLREELSGNLTVVVQALAGMGGVGKTQVALEYAYRFAPYYEVIWWISAEQPGLVRSGLAGLAERLALPAGESVEENVAAVLEALRSGDPYGRWLLVFDNAGDPSEIQNYIPSGSGHVLVTSRDQAWAQQPAASMLPLDVFQRDESIALLRKKLPNSPESDLDLVADNLGDLPLAIEQAGAWLAATGMAVSQYLTLLDTELPRILEEHLPLGYHQSAAKTWTVSLQRLKRETPAAAKLLEICAFFSPEPIPMSLVIGEKSKRFIEALLHFDPLLRDPILRGHMIREIGRFALARIDSAGPTIQLHRLVQAVIRATLPPDEAFENQRIVQEVLAAANPGEPDDSRNWPAYREIRVHLPLSGALGSTNRDVRQLILDLTRFLYKISDYTASAELAEEAVAQWEAEPDGVADVQTLQLRFHLANSLRAQARYEEALRIDEQVHTRLRDQLGVRHPHTILALSSLAADQRALGNYLQARELQQETLDLCTQELGDLNERTLMAANNLAVSLRLVGDFEAARRLDEETLEKRRQVLPEGNSYILFSANNLGRDLRELGDYEGARRRLEETLIEYRRIFGESYTETQRTARNLAIALRKLGRFRDALELNVSTLAALTELQGARHPETLACACNLAADYSALGDNEKAHQTGTDVYRRYRQALGENHPFTLGAANNLAIFALKLGRIEEAVTLSEQAVVGLKNLLGPLHPYTLLSTINMANNEFERGNYELARTLDAETFRQMRRVLTEDHPDTIAVQHNLAVSARAVGDEAEAQLYGDDALSRVTRVLGAEHPNTLAVMAGNRLNCDFDPPSP